MSPFLMVDFQNFHIYSPRLKIDAVGNPNRAKIDETYFKPNPLRVYLDPNTRF